MKIQRRRVLALIVTSLLTEQALAEIGKISFKGSYVQVSCNVVTGDADQTIEMGDASFYDLPLSIGQSVISVGIKKITVHVECTSGADSLDTIVMAFDAKAGSGVDVADSRLLNISDNGNGATGVAIAILDSTNKIIDLNSNIAGVQGGLIPGPTLGEATGSVVLGAAYVLNGETTHVGPGNASLPFELTYE